MRLLLYPLLVACSIPSLCLAETLSQGSMWNSLSPAQQTILSSGKPVVLEEEVLDNAWPRFIVYQIARSSAEKAAAVFWDCELDSKYIPNCLSVELVAKPEPWIHDGQYTLKMPMMLPNEVYISRNELKIPSPGTYEISWNVLHASYIKGSKGNLRVEPLANSTNALLRYSNLVMPGSSIAGLLRVKARSQVIESVNALVIQIEKENKSFPQLIDHQIYELENALKSLPQGK